MSKKGSHLKSGYFSAIGLFKMVRDMLLIITSNGGELLNVDDLE